MSVALRDEIDKSYKWKIEDIYSSDEEYEKDFQKVQEKLKEKSVFEGKAGDCASNLAGVIKEQDDMENQVERLYVYANMKYYEDMGNSRYQAYAKKSHNLMSDFCAKYSFVEPQILAIDDEVIKEYLSTDIMKPYIQYIDNITRQKKHILSESMEAVMAEVSKVASAAADIFASFNNADIKFGEIVDENGCTTELTNGRYTHFMESHNQSVRKAVYDRLYSTYGGYINTLASCYNANVMQARFFAGQRNYNSSMEASLDSSNIPVSVYNGLIDAVNSHIQLMHRYVKLRKKALGLEKLHMYDVYAPLVDDFTMKVSFEEAKNIVAEGLKPLGGEYIGILKKGYSEGWIDVYENKGKRTGAFSWGTYGVHPYVFMNYQENLDSVFTLAHEMGHAIHSYYSNSNQPHIYAGYRIFVAEVASTCNEALLIQHMIQQADNKKEKAYLINHFMEQFKGTMFRQTMFAEFEKNAHEMAADGEILTAGVLNDMYKKLNEKYFGPDMVIDDNISMEWSRIPHFYTPFYVYQYATGFAAAVAISQKILKEGESAVKGYKEFLSAGSSDYPIEVLKKAGVDMSRPEALEGAFEVFSNLLDEFEKLIEE